MKENLISDKSLIYQWYFNNNISVVDNPRVKATVFGNPTFKDGVAIFNGSTDYYKLKTLINLGTRHSISIKFYANNFIGNPRILANTSANGLLFVESSNEFIYRCNNINVQTSGITIPRNQWNTIDIIRNSSNILIYLNGVLILTKTDFNTNLQFKFNTIGWDELNGIFNGQLEYIKIWNCQLTASEVKNNYTGKTYRSLPYKSTTLFHINSDNGVIRDLTGKTTPVATNVQLPKIGSNINVMKFNGSSGNVNLGNQALVGDITFMGWINNINRGEYSEGNIINNGKFIIRRSGSISVGIGLKRVGEVVVATISLPIDKNTNSYFLYITSTSTGITNIYIGDKNNPPILSGTANQSAGTPVAGGICYLGNRALDDRTLNGWLNDVRMEQSILTLEEVTQYWSSTKQKYQ